MRIKLNYKLLMYSMIMIVCLIALITLPIVISNKNFEVYIKDFESEKVSSLAEAIKIFYSENSGWGSLKGNFGLWDNLMEKAWLKRGSIVVSDPKWEPPPKDIIAIIYKNEYMAPVWDPLDLGPRISLLDEHKEFIVGRNTSPIEESSLFQIRLEGKTIGWLSLKEGRKFYQPLDRAFRQNQLKLLFITGVIYLCVLIFITFLFSKQILFRITQLAEATKKLECLNFNVRVPVKSLDEVGELALHFNNMAQKLLVYERNQKQWLTDTSHELRTPLSVLICQIEALKDGIQKPDKKSLISLSNEVRHLMKLVNDLNDISLIESGTLRLNKKLLKPLPILSDNVYVFKKRFQNKNMSIDFEFDEKAADIQMLGDYDRIKQLFSNILDNAINHTEKPGKLVIRQILNSDHIKFIFEDSGPGVPDEALPFLFDRLYRVDSSRSRKTGGNGLGLAICKSIVEMHKGMIRARNVQGGGLMIEISMPIKSNLCNQVNEQKNIKNTQV